MEQNYIEDKILTIHYDGRNFEMFHSRWEWNGEKYESFDLLFPEGIYGKGKTKVLGHWNCCPVYWEMIQTIANVLEGD